MTKRLFILINILQISAFLYAARDDGRSIVHLSDDGWFLWLDKEAEWKVDKLYLPSEINMLSDLPVNTPTGGWHLLNEKNAISVSVPGTVEEFLTETDHPQPQHFQGVSWWFRTIQIDKNIKDKHFILHFESVRLRAEIYLDGKLVGYDIIGESPFEADITDAVKPGTEQQLSIRVTNPGGNFHWQDFDIMKWDNYNVPPGRGFGGIIGRVNLWIVDPVYIADIYMQNTPEITSVNAIVSLENRTTSCVNKDVEVVVKEKNNSSVTVFTRKIKNVAIPTGRKTLSVPIHIPDAKIWDLNTPELYVCEVLLQKGKKTTDKDEQTFGFRWFNADGIGENAVFRLNGRRIMLRSAISWGYFPATGLHASVEMAERQVRTAKELGLNMLNFHRSIGSPIVLEKADELGLLYYEEPGSFHSATHDPFIRAMVNEKLKRMIHRDRSHPSLVIYNLINEYGGPKALDKTLVSKRMNDMREAHAIDLSRIMTFTSGWASSENAEEDSKAHMLPFDTTLYRKGWFDNHRAGGPETWIESYYKGPTDNIMYTDNCTEVYLRGEEGALSTPPRISLIHDEIQRKGKTGWDGLFWEKQYTTFATFFKQKKLEPYFGTLDAFTQKMGNVSFEHQGRRIQGMRMQNIGDAYMINGWESMPYDNHSGIVDIYRNPKGDASVLAYYNQPLYVAVVARSQVIRLGNKVEVDFYMVNEKDLKGNHTLEIKVIEPNGKVLHSEDHSVDIKGGEIYGQLLFADKEFIINGREGTYRIEAIIKDYTGKKQAEGFDEIIAVKWKPEDLKGKGAYYGKPNDNDKAAAFYRYETGKELKAFTPDMDPLDWLVVTRPSLDESTVIDPAYFIAPDGQQSLQVTWYSDHGMNLIASTNSDANIRCNFVEGTQPHESIPANQPFSVVWEGKLYPKESGLYLVGIKTNQGVRLYIDGRSMIDEFYSESPITQDRPVMMIAGNPVSIRVEYRQTHKSGHIQLCWSQPGSTTVDPKQLIERVQKDGTTLILLDATETWMQAVAEHTGIEYNGYYNVGKDWIGGVHYVKNHPLFEGLPVNDAMNWPYQAVVRNGDRRFGFRMNGEEMVVGSYRSMPFELGSAVGIITHGKGKIIFSTLNITDNLNQTSGAPDVAKKIFCNYIKYATRNKIVANPLNLNYRFQWDESNRREAADPVLEYFKDKYYLFASKSGGYWSSPDLHEWTYIPCKSIATIEAYAPTIVEYDGMLYYMASERPRIFRNATPDKDTWEEIDSKFPFGITDPAFFKDDDGKMFLYWGCSEKDPIMGVRVDPKDGFRAMNDPVVLISHHPDMYGWENPGHNNEEYKNGWNEGSCMLKHNERYYLHYAAPGTQFRIYGNGIYTSGNPLGPFTYTECNPFSFKPGGFMGGAGHGHTFKDRYGNYWHVSTTVISVRHMFERRIGLFPAYIDDQHNLQAHTVFSDYPYNIPDSNVDFRTNDCSMNWNLLSYNKPTKTSSSQKGYEKNKANDEKIETWWAASTGKKGEWWQLDLGRIMVVSSIQVNFADHNFTITPPDSYVYYQYKVEYSENGRIWKTIIDRTDNLRDMPHELIVLDKPIDTRYLRIINSRDLDGSFSLYGFRVFGSANIPLPDEVPALNILRDESDQRIICFSWPEQKSVTGYILRWGIEKDHLSNAIMVYNNKYEGRHFNRDSDYYFSIEAFNEAGQRKSGIVYQAKNKEHPPTSDKIIKNNQ